MSLRDKTACPGAEGQHPRVNVCPQVGIRTSLCPSVDEMPGGPQAGRDHEEPGGEETDPSPALLQQELTQEADKKQMVAGLSLSLQTGRCWEPGGGGGGEYG